MAGLRRPDAGRVDVLGIDAFAEPRHARERVGLVPQQLGIYPSLTVRENLQLFGELGGLRGEALAGRLEEVAAAFGLERLAGRQARRLSGGEQRRLHIAMALVRRRPLLLLDEPLAGLDPDWRGSVLELEGRLASEGVAVCHATNDPGEVEALGGRVAVLEAGRMVSGGRVHDVAPA